MLRWVLAAFVITGCSSTPPVKPAKPKAPKREPAASAPTDAQRLEEAQAIVPKGSTCIPVALHRKDAPRLELAAVGSDAVICAYDTQRDRLLGPVGCWTVVLDSSELVYREPAPLPGIGFPARIEDSCVRGLCLPSDAVPADKVAHVAYSADGSKAVVLAHDQVSLFDARSRTRESGFAVKGIGQIGGIYLLNDFVFVEAGEQGRRRVVMFKTDGTKLGAINDEKDQPLVEGSFSLLDKTRVGIAEPGWSALIVLDTETDKKTRITRAVPKSPCTADESGTYWAGGDDVSEKCNSYMVKTYDHLVGATAVAGARNLLVLLRNGRLGELGVLDTTNLVEKKALGLPWCEEPSSE